MNTDCNDSGLFVEKLKVSVITVCRNSNTTIGDAIASVSQQVYPNVEHVIVDGVSTDGTLDIIKKSIDARICKFISEPDFGIYDAMNKGLKISTGDIVGFLNSDDVFSNEFCLSDIVSPFSDPNVHAVYGDLVYVKKDDLSVVIRFWRSSPHDQNAFKNGWHPAHPTFYVRKSIFDRFGGFDLRYKIAADYELMFRFLYKIGINSFYIPKVLVRMRVGGESNRTLKNIVQANLECLDAWRRNELPIPYLLIVSKPISKLRQFFRVFIN